VLEPLTERLWVFRGRCQFLLLDLPIKKRKKTDHLFPFNLMGRSVSDPNIKRWISFLLGSDKRRDRLGKPAAKWNHNRKEKASHATARGFNLKHRNKTFIDQRVSGHVRNAVEIVKFSKISQSQLHRTTGQFGVSGRTKFSEAFYCSNLCFLSCLEETHFFFFFFFFFSLFQFFSQRNS